MTPEFTLPVPMDVLFLLMGLVLLILGGQALVSGAASLARTFRIAPLIIGLTVVAYGTSSPEMAVSIKAALAGSGDMSLGNVVGSNIFNVLFILGLSALVRPLVVEPQLVRLDVPVMMGVSSLALLMGLDGRISRLDGAVLLLGALAYTWLQISLGKKGRREEAARTIEAERPPPSGSAGLIGRIALILLGLALLVLGADWLVGGAVELARDFGVSELVIGLTIVAAGTSMPEVAASVIATLRKEASMAVGNVVGSNVFNILAVLGATAVVAPGGVAVPPSALSFDLPVMAVVALACLPIFTTGHRIARWEGALFFGFYLAYTVYLILDATGHRLQNEFSAAFWGFVLPLALVTLGVSLYRHLRERRTARH